MADEQVGTVSVKVLPDTKGFRKKLKAELEAIERGLEVVIEVGVELSKADLAAAKAELKKLGETARVKVKTDLDSSSLNDAVKAALERAQAMADNSELRATLDSLTADTEAFRAEIRRAVERATEGLKAEIPADLWDEGIRGKLDRLIKELNSLGDVEVGVDLRDDDFRARYEALMAQIEEETAKIRVNLDADRMRREYEAIINQMRQNSLDLPIQLENIAEAAAQAEELARDRSMTVHARVDAARAFAEIAVLARDRTINFKAEFRDSAVGSMARTLAGLSGLRTISNLSSDLTDLVQEMDSALKTVAIFSTGLATLAGAGISAAGGVLAVGKGLFDVGRAGLLLPAVLSGLAVGFGVVKMSLARMGDYIPDVTSDFALLATAMTDNFWATAADNAAAFNDVFQPIAEKGVPAVSRALGDMAGAVADSMTAFTKAGGVEKFFTNLEKGYRNGIKGMGSLTDAVLDLVGAGSKYFPAMGDAFTKSMGQFSKWTDKITSDGTFDRWMRQAADSAVQFGSIMRSTGGILSGFYKASVAAGGPTLKDIANGFRAVSDAVNSTRGMNFITTMFEGAYASMRNLAPGLRDLGNAFVDLGPAMSKSMALAGRATSTFFSHLGTMISDPRFGAGMVKMFEGFNKGIEALRPVFESLGGDIGMLMSSFGLLAEVLGKVVGTASRELGVLFQDLLRVVDAIIPVLGDWLISAIEAIAPAVRNAAGAIVDFTEAHPKLAAAAVIAATALGALVKIVGLVAGPFSKALAEVSKLKDLLGKMPKPMAGLAGAAGTAGSKFSGLARAVGGAGRFLGRFGGWAALAGAAVVEMWKKSEKLRDATKRLGGALVNLGKEVGEAVGPEIKEFATKSLPELMDSMGRLLDKTAPVAKFFGDVLGDAIDRFAAKIEIATPAIKKFAGFLGNAINEGTQGAADAIDGFTKLIEGDWTGAWESFKKASEHGVNMWPEDMREGINRVREQLIQFVEQDLANFVNGIRGFAEDAGAFFGNLPETIGAALDAVKSWIVTKVVEWFVAMGEAILTGIGTIVQFFQTLPETIGAIYDLVRDFIVLKVSEWFLAMGEAIMTGIATIVQFFATLPEQIGLIYDLVRDFIVLKVTEWFLAMGEAIMLGIATIAQFFATLPEQIGLIYDLVRDFIVLKVAEWFLFMGQAIITGIATIVQYFQGLYDGIALVMATIAAQLVAAAIQWFIGLASTVSQGIARVVGFFSELPGKVMSAIASLLGSLVSTATGWMSQMGSIVSQGISRVVSFFSELPGKVLSAIASLLGTLVSTATNWMVSMASAVSQGIARVVSFFSELPGKVVSAVSGAIDMLRTVGSQMMEGLIGGITAMAGRVAEAARSVVAGAVKAAKAALGVHSPSRVFWAIGEYTGAGYVKGLASMEGPVMRATDSLMAVPSPVKLPKPVASSAGDAGQAGMVGSGISPEELLAALGGIRLSVDGRDLHTTVQDLNSKFARR